MPPLDRYLILTQAEWAGLLSNKIISASIQAALFIGFTLLIINDRSSFLGGDLSLPSLYTLTIFTTLLLSSIGVYFRTYHVLPIAVIIFNVSYIVVDLHDVFVQGIPIKVITVCYSVMYFVINAIAFKLYVVLAMNLAVFCAVQSSRILEAAGGTAAQPFMLNALVLSAAALLLQHLVLTVRGRLIEQLGSARLQMAALEAEIEIENARREAREKAIQLNRISVVEALGASIAHEINQPIAAALTYSRAARNWANIECEGAPETLRAVAGVESNVDRAARLIDNIRLLTTKRERSYALSDVREIVRDQVNLVQAEFEKRGINLVLEPGTTETSAVVCAPEIALATINLLRNAMEAFDEPSDDSIVSVICRRAGPGWIEVMIIDNGKGMTPEDLQKAFGAFQSTKETGAGIGLSICQEVAEHHSGSISLTPNAARGMIATLRLAQKPIGI